MRTSSGDASVGLQRVAINVINVNSEQHVPMPLDRFGDSGRRRLAKQLPQGASHENLAMVTTDANALTKPCRVISIYRLEVYLHAILIRHMSFMSSEIRISANHIALISKETIFSRVPWCLQMRIEFNFQIVCAALQLAIAVV